jgi:hypothetical protein
MLSSIAKGLATCSATATCCLATSCDSYPSSIAAWFKTRPFRVTPGASCGRPRWWSQGAGQTLTITWVLSIIHGAVVTYNGAPTKVMVSRARTPALSLLFIGTLMPPFFTHHHSPRSQRHRLTISQLLIIRQLFAISPVYTIASVVRKSWEMVLAAHTPTRNQQRATFMTAS